MRSGRVSGPEGGGSRSLLHQAVFPSLAPKQPCSERQSRAVRCQDGRGCVCSWGGLASPTLAIHSVAAGLV